MVFNRTAQHFVATIQGHRAQRLLKGHGCTFHQGNFKGMRPNEGRDSAIHLPPTPKPTTRKCVDVPQTWGLLWPRRKHLHLEQSRGGSVHESLHIGHMIRLWSRLFGRQISMLPDFPDCPALRFGTSRFFSIYFFQRKEEKMEGRQPYKT